MSLSDLELLRLCYEGEDRLVATERPVLFGDHGLMAVHLIETPPRIVIDRAIVRSDRAVAAWLHAANPGNWHPIEWTELLEGSLGPWAMVVAEDRVLSICHTPVPLTSSTAEPGTWTTPDARGRGYAAAATAEWVAMLRPSGRSLFYVHAVGNESSRRVAARLHARAIGWSWHRGAPPVGGSDVHPLSRAEQAPVMVIERLRPGDGERWRGLRLRALTDAPYAFGTTLAEASQWPASRWEEQVEAIATFVAVSDGEDVGVVRGIAHPDVAEAREAIGMWVDPRARRRSVGTALMRAVCEWARGDGARTLVLDVVEENGGAIAFYGGLGFERYDGNAFGGRGAGEIRMVRALGMSGP